MTTSLACVAQPFYLAVGILFYFFITLQVYGLVPLLVLLGLAIIFGISLGLRSHREIVSRALATALALGIVPPWLIGVGAGLLQLRDSSWIVWLIVGLLAELGWCIAICVLHRRKTSKARNPLLPVAQKAVVLLQTPQPVVDVRVA